MGKADKLHHKRQQNNREKFSYFYIFCDGEKTEKNYFEDMLRPLNRKNEKKKYKVIGKGLNTKSHIKEAEKYVKKGDECWIVYDIDSFPKKNIHNMQPMANARSYNVVYSNECFELRYILHFQDYTNPESRKQYAKYITKGLQKLLNSKTVSYEKNMQNLYQILQPLQDEAMMRAKKLYALNTSELDGSSIADIKPLTTVYNLIERLIKEHTII